MVLQQIVSGYILGVVVGLFMRIFSKIILFIIGGFVAFLIFLQSLGFIVIKWTNIFAVVGGLIIKLIALGGTGVLSLLSIPLFGVSFVFGLYTSYLLPKLDYKFENFKYARIK